MSDVLQEVAELLFGGGGDELIAKMEPTQSDIATKDRNRRRMTAGLSAVGATAGAAGLALGGHNLRRSYKLARGSEKLVNAGKHAGAMKPMTRGAAIGHAVSQEKLATGLIPLEVAGLGGELSATKILHGDTKQKKPKLKPIQKSQTGVLRKDLEVPTTRKLALAAATNPTVKKKGKEYTKKGAGFFKKLPDEVEKSAEVDVIWDGEIAKTDTDKQQIFGWASVVEVDGHPVVDLQGDYISPDEMEKAGYEYVMKSRKGGDMHLRNDWSPIQKSEMIESFIVTDEKKQAMGLPDSVPTGWWVGFQVQDQNLWADVKSGKRTGFSIHGRGKRTPS